MESENKVELERKREPERKNFDQPELMIEMDLNCQIIGDWQNRLDQSFGKSLGRLANKNLYDLVHEQDLSTLSRMRREVLELQRPGNGEILNFLTHNPSSSTTSYTPVYVELITSYNNSKQTLIAKLFRNLNQIPPSSPSTSSNSYSPRTSSPPSHHLSSTTTTQIPSPYTMNQFHIYPNVQYNEQHSTFQSVFPNIFPPVNHSVTHNVNLLLNDTNQMKKQ